MGKYKDKNGTTFMGDLLRKVKDVGVEVGPELLKVAGTLTGADKLVDLGKALDGESAINPELKKEIMAMAVKRIEADIVEQQEVTKRWSADMTSDSWLSKNIRPLIVGWLVLFTSVIIVTDSIDGVDFEVKAVYVTLLASLLTTTIVAYFGSRGMEKWNKIRAKWKANK